MPKAPQLSILIPLYNEEAILAGVVQSLLARISELGLSSEILLLENGSTDGTLASARQFETEHPDVVRAFHVRHPDYGSAVLEGLRLARGEFGVVFEADLVDVPFVEEHLPRLRDEAEMVIGSKMHPDSRDERPMLRKAFSLAFNRLLFLLFRFRGRETHGLKLFRIAPLLPIAESCVSRADTFTSEWVIRAQWQGARIVEVPMTIREIRAPSVSPLKRIPEAVRSVGKMAAAMELRGPLASLVVYSGCVVLLLAGIWTFSRAPLQPYNVDEAIYNYVGWSWTTGEWPYRDVWDHKGPVVYATTALRNVFLGTESGALRVQELLLGAMNALLLAMIGARLWGFRGAALASTMFILLWTHQPPNFGHMSTPGSLIALLTSLAVLAALETAAAQRARTRNGSALLFGIAVSLALLVKPNAVSGAAAGALVIWFATRSRRRRTLRLAPWTAAGVVVSLIVAVALFRSAGALDAWIDAYFNFNSTRGRLMLENRGLVSVALDTARLLKTHMILALTGAVAGGALIACVRGYWLRMRGALMMQGPEFALLIWLLAELGLLWSNGAYGHHVFPLFPALALGTTWLILSPLRGGVGGRTLSLALSVLVLGPLVFGVLSEWIDPQEPQRSLWESQDDLVQRMVELTDQDQRILNVTGWSQPAAMALAGRRSASRYVYPIPLYVKGYASDRRWLEVLDGVRHRPPGMILIDRGRFKEVPGDLVDWLARRFAQPLLPGVLADAQPYLNRRRLAEWIGQHYRLETCVPAACLLVPQGRT